MQIFGIEITRKKSRAATSVDGRNGFWQVLFDQFTGAWQQDVAINQVNAMQNHAVFSCITLIANDIGKLRPMLKQKNETLIWKEIQDDKISPVLRRPNRYQNHIQFIECWMQSKLSRGNTYVFKQRDRFGNVFRLHVLDPDRVTPLVTPDGDVYYRLSDDNMAGIQVEITVPASEIIHDRINTLFHPLVGLSPIFANGLAATQGLAIQKNSARFFTNMSRASGMLVAPGPISKENAQLLKEDWEKNFTGDNYGKTAVLGDGLKYERMSMSAEESQMLEQLKWSAEVIAGCFHIPAFKIGIGQMPTNQNSEVMNQIYYSDCLQSHIEQFEVSLDEGLGLDGHTKGIELDLDGLMRMDTPTKVKTITEAIKGTLMAPNEGRAKFDLEPLDGGDTVYMQQQNYSLAALNERDKSNPLAVQPAPVPDPDEVADKALLILNLKRPETIVYEH